MHSKLAKVSLKEFIISNQCLNTLSVFDNNKNVNFGHSDAFAYSKSPSIIAGVLEHLANSQADGLALGR